MSRFRVFSLLSILMLFGVSAYGRDSGTYTIKAVILDKTGEPLSGATMQLVQSGLWGISGKDGEVEIRNDFQLPIKSRCLATRMLRARFVWMERITSGYSWKRSLFR